MNGARKQPAHGLGSRWRSLKTPGVRALEAQQTERGLLVTLGDVLLAFNKAELSAQAAPDLDKLANFLNQFPDCKLLIGGYTDSVGGDSNNQDLPDHCVQAVRDALVQRGVNSSRITARGYGKAHPVADNASPEGRAMSRRVEIVITDDKGNEPARALRLSTQRFQLSVRISNHPIPRAC